MAAVNKAYGLFFKHAMQGEIPWLAEGGAALKVALLLNTYTLDQDGDEVFGDVSAHEVSDSGTGYTAGGAAVTLIDPAYTADGNILKMDCSDAEFAELTLTARYAILYATNATAGLRYLVSCLDFGEDKVVSAEPFKVRISADGAVQITVG